MAAGKSPAIARQLKAPEVMEKTVILFNRRKGDFCRYKLKCQPGLQASRLRLPKPRIVRKAGYASLEQRIITLPLPVRLEITGRAFYFYRLGPPATFKTASETRSDSSPYPVPGVCAGGSGWLPRRARRCSSGRRFPCSTGSCAGRRRV